MKVAIVGSRNYKSLTDVDRAVHLLPEGTIVISGGAKGVDERAAYVAKSRGLDVKIFIPMWSLYGKGAGMIRNQQIVDYSDMLIAFWDGESKGTKHAFSLALKAGVPVYLRSPEGWTYVPGLRKWEKDLTSDGPFVYNVRTSTQEFD